MRAASLVIFAVLIAFPGVSGAQAIPNPIAVTYDFRANAQTYNVDCWSTRGVRGTWLPITGTVVTTQESLIIPAAPPPPPGHPTRPPAVYCLSTDGKPGIISGAPAGLLLPPGSRIQQYVTVLIILKGSGGRSDVVSTGIMPDAQSRVDFRPSGVFVQTDEHDVTVYPAESRVTINAGSGYGFTRPGTPVPTAAPHNGCTVTYRDGDNTVTDTKHFNELCSLLVTSIHQRL